MIETWQAATPTVTVRAVASQDMVTLRLRRPSADDLARVASLIGVEPPSVPNTAAGDRVRAIWIGPDEWLIVGATAAIPMIEAAAVDAAAVSCVSVGDGRCLIDVMGANAAELIAKAVPIDLHPRAFPANSSAMTLFAQVNVIIDRRPGLDGFRLIFDVSFRGYLQRWFYDAVVEFE